MCVPYSLSFLRFPFFAFCWFFLCSVRHLIDFTDIFFFAATVSVLTLYRFTCACKTCLNEIKLRRPGMSKEGRLSQIIALCPQLLRAGRVLSISLSVGRYLFMSGAMRRSSRPLSSASGSSTLTLPADVKNMKWDQFSWKKPFRLTNRWPYLPWVDRGRRHLSADE